MSWNYILYFYYLGRRPLRPRPPLYGLALPLNPSGGVQHTTYIPDPVNTVLMMALT